MLKLYEESAIQDIANSIRAKMEIENKMTVPEMPNYIQKISGSSEVFDFNIDIVPSHLDNDGNWVRPDEYEDLSQIQLDDDREEVYLSLYNRHDGLWHLGLYVTAGKGYKVELGHIVNDAFIASEEYLKANNAYFEVILPENEETMVARITPQDINYHITGFRFGRIAKATSGKIIDIPYYYQSVVERIGKLPYVTSLISSSTNYGYGACYLEHDAIKVGYKTNLTNLNYAWQYCYNLQKLEVNDWDTSHWAVTVLNSTWLHCYSLEKLDLSNWNTTNWTVTNLANCFQNCYYLKELKQNWNTTNWRITTLTNMFDKCYSLEKLDLSNWDTTNWKVTDIGGSSSIFSFCYSLKELKQNWNTTNWAVKSLQSLFKYCYSLEKLDLSNWDTTNWAVTRTDEMFSNCYKLKEFKQNFNTTNWAVTSLSNMFAYCHNIKEIDLSNWDTTNWPVTSLNTMFTLCYNLTKINLSNWNTSNFSIGAGNYFSIFNQTCYSLQEINMEGWDFSGCRKLDLFNALFNGLYSLKKVNLKNWKFGDVKFSTMNGMFQNCWSLEELDLSSWDTSNFEITTLQNMFNMCRSLKSFKQNFDTTNWKVTSISNLFSECWSLKEIDLSNWNILNWTLTSIGSIFKNCRTLNSVNLSNWNLSKLNGSIEAMFQCCYNLQELDLSSWNTQTANITSMRYFIDDCWKLKKLNLSNLNNSNTSYPVSLNNTSTFALVDYYPPATINQNNIDFSKAPNLSYESIMRIINNLPTITQARTLTLGVLRSKLTPEELAIATQKGWSVA